MKRHHRPRVFAALMATTALCAVTACSANADPSASSSPTTSVPDEEGADANSTDTSPPTGGAGTRVRLAPFDSCDAFLGYIQAEAMERVGPYGLEGGPMYYEFAVEETEEAAAEDDSVGTDSATSADGDDSGDATDFTNNQEQGVDEADIVKTDGERLIALSESRISVIDVASRQKLGSIDLPDGWGHQMFLVGDRIVVVVGGVPEAVPFATTDAEADFATDSLHPGEPSGWSQQSAVYDIDISDPANPTIEAEMRIDGYQLSMRRIGDHIRLVTSSQPGNLPWLYPASPSGEDRATEANRALIAETTIDDWLPGYQLAVGDQVTEGRLSDCDRLHRPNQFSGFQVLSVTDIMVTENGISVDPTGATGVLASGDTVYSSLDRMYVATTRWVEPEVVDGIQRWPDGEEFSTHLHSFAIAAGEPTRYLASGSVAGSLLNQFSLDEHDGNLRVVTTEGTPWDSDNLSESTLTVMTEDGDELVTIGSVGGLGQGERVYSARLMGDLGFVVTFREIDPFYVLDLSDPANPRVTGELKLPGVSTYLHPVDENHVLGIGRDITEDGQNRGIKLSLFDVTDRSNPVETSQWTIDGYTPAEYDHKAFQMRGSLAVLPVQTYNTEFGDDAGGAFVFDISTGIEQLGVIRHEELDAKPNECRELTVDDVASVSDSEFYYMVLEGWGNASVCGPDQTSGTSCERIPSGDLDNWIYSETGDAAETFRAEAGIGPDDVVELCWDDGAWLRAVQRSFIIDDTIWTMSQDRFKVSNSNDFSELATIPLP